jgi:excisionase family DNA binding protein
VSKQYVPISQVCETYSVSERSVRRWIASGRLSAIRLGGKSIRVDLDEVERNFVKSAIGGDA